jgi:nucleotide-binding universal stress UspA family protein
MTTEVRTVTAPRDPPEGGEGNAPVVVVGVDGSAAAQEALLFAAREAQLRRAVLHIVAAHDLGPAAYGYAGSAGGWELGTLEDGLREAAESLAKAAADTVATELPGPAVHVRTIVVQGRPSHVLLDAAEGATLLVVGARGAGALTRLLMGSTSTEVVHEARLPVTVVPSHRSPTPTTGGRA